MYIPDRVIVRKIKEFDPHLFVEWNNRKGWFEVWRYMPHGRRLITPVTHSIYNPQAKNSIRFCPLDERIIQWLYLADSWRFKEREMARLRDEEWVNRERKKDEKRRQTVRDMAYDTASLVTSFHVTDHKVTKNKLFNQHSPNQNKWLRPDVQYLTSPRLMGRSFNNAKAYNFKKWSR